MPYRSFILMLTRNFQKNQHMNTYSIFIVIDQQTYQLNVNPGHTPAQLIDYLRQNNLVSSFGGPFCLLFNDQVLPQHDPIGNYGVGPADSLVVAPVQKPGFGTGKETMLMTALRALLQLKKS
jgi:hypothetical protein